MVTQATNTHGKKNRGSTPVCPLSERREKVLVRYHDGEASLLDAMQAKLFLALCADSRDFFKTLDTIRDIARSDDSHISATRTKRVDLWSNIESRIAEEERAALYLGTRPAALDLSSGANTPRHTALFERFFWGASGALVAASVTLVATTMFGGKEQEGLGRPQQFVLSRDTTQGEGASSRYTPVAARRSAHINEIPVSSGTLPFTASATRIPQATEVDWVRSEGSVQMIQDPIGRSAILWVKPRAAVKIPQSNDSNDQIIVYRERTPRTIAASQQRYVR
jgi:hypothetical protein